MADARRDNNRVTTLLALSSVDGVTPVTLYADPTTHRLLVDLAGGGSGDVVGPGGSTDNAVVRFDGATGKLLQNSTVLISDAGVVTGASIDGGTNTLSGILTSSLASTTGADTDVVSGTAGINGNISQWNTDGDLVDGGIAVADVVTPSSSDTFTNKSGAISQWTNDSGYLTSVNLASDVTGVLPVANGGTGQSTYTNGQLLIGNTTGNTLTKATLTAGTGITVTNGTGSITLATTALLNVVEDTTPQLGGDLDTNSNNIQFDDAHGIQDSNGNEQITFEETASAVNEFSVTNAATGNAPELSASGNDTNIDIQLTPKGTGIVKGELKFYSVRLVASGTDVATGTSIGGDYRPSPDHAITIKSVGAYVDTAGTTGVSTIDINEGGTTILSTKITIDSGEKTSTTAATAPVISDSAIAADGIITYDVDGVSTTAPQGLTVWYYYVYS